MVLPPSTALGSLGYEASASLFMLWELLVPVAGFEPTA